MYAIRLTAPFKGKEIEDNNRICVYMDVVKSCNKNMNLVAAHKRSQKYLLVALDTIKTNNGIVRGLSQVAVTYVR